MTPEERWDRACKLLAAIGGSATVQTLKSGGCSATVYFRNRVEGCLGKVYAKSKPDLRGQEAIDAVLTECAGAIERNARRVRGEIDLLLEGTAP